MTTAEALFSSLLYGPKEQFDEEKNVKNLMTMSLGILI
jgi:hypothetical protein